MRSFILFWSAVSGLVLGLLAGIAALAVILLGAELLAPWVPRLAGRARMLAVVATMVVVPVAGTLVGFLEGRLKLR